MRQQDLVRKLLGDDVAKNASDRSGASARTAKWRNMWKRTPQEGLWFIAGGLAQCRIYSKYLALQIKAIEEGLLPRDVGPRAAIS